MATTDPVGRPNWPRRLFWFVALWMAGVAVTGTVAVVLRAVLL